MSDVDAIQQLHRASLRRAPLAVGGAGRAYRVVDPEKRRVARGLEQERSELALLEQERPRGRNEGDQRSGTDARIWRN